MGRYTGVFKRTDTKGTSWYFKLDVGTVGGKRNVVRRGGFTTEKEAHDARVAEEARLKTGNYADPGQLTTGEYLERWMRDLRRAESTNATYRFWIGTYVVPRIGTVKLRDLSPTHITELYRQAETDHTLSGTSLHNMHRTLRTALNDAIREGLLVSNPTTRLANPPRRDTQAMKFWSLEQAQKFAKEAGDHYLYPAWMLMLAASMRRGEVCGIQVADLDLNAGQLHLQRARVVTTAGDTYVSPGKTKGSRRLMSLDADLVRVLRRHLKSQAEWKLAAGTDWQPGDWLFTYPSALAGHLPGDPVRPELLSRTFKEVTAKLGLPRIRLYDLRHTSATLALLQGIHPKVVQERLGHATIQQTLDTYSHVVPGMHEQAAEELGQAIFGAKEIEKGLRHIRSIDDIERDLREGES